MAHIVILGAGIGGMPAAYEMREMLPKEHKITVINAVDFFQFVPSNPWLAVGWRKPDELMLKVGPLLARKGIDFIAKLVTKIEPDANQLQLADGQTVGYDYLVITTGPKLSFAEVPGAGPVHSGGGGYTHSVCTVPHAEAFWADYQKFLENPGPLVIGAMPMASCFGPAYEFAFILDTDLRRRKLRNKVPITFVTSEPYIGHLGLGGVGDSKSMLESEMRNRDMKWITNAKTTKVEEGKLFATQLDDLGNVFKEHEVPFKLSMMLPAFKGVDAVAAVPNLCNPRGFVLIDDYQRSKAYKNIFSAGVCVAIPPVEVTPVPTGAPKTGYMIARPAWWRATIWIDSIFFGPFYAFAIYAYWKGKNWIRFVSIIWASVMLTNVSIILFEEVCGEHASPQLARVFLSNAAWVIFPLMVMYRMWRSVYPFSLRVK